MRNKITFDIYTIIMIAIVPVFLLTAWGLTWNHERVAQQESCANASAFLTDAADLVPAYVSSGAVGNTDTWLTQLESLTSPPGAAKDLRDTILSSMSYAINTDSDLETSGTGEIFDTLTPFQDSITGAKTDLMDECPDTAPLIPQAFPMFYRSGDVQ